MTNDYNQFADTLGNLQTLGQGLFVFVVFMAGMLAFICYRLGRMRCLVPFLLLGLASSSSAGTITYTQPYGGSWFVTIVDSAGVYDAYCVWYGDGGGSFGGSGATTFNSPNLVYFPFEPVAYHSGGAAAPVMTTAPGAVVTDGVPMATATNWVPLSINAVYNLTNNGTGSLPVSVIGPNGQILFTAPPIAPGGTASFTGYPSGSYLSYAPSLVGSSTTADGNTVWQPITEDFSVGAGISYSTNWGASGSPVTSPVPTVNGVTQTNPPPVTINGGLISAGDSNIVAAINSSAGSGSSGSGSSGGGLNSSQAAALTNAAAADTSTNFTAPGNVTASTNVSTGFPTFTALNTLTPASPSMEVSFSALNSYLPAGVDGFTDATLDWSTETFWPALIAQFRSFELLLVTLGFVFLAVRTVKGISS
jgi:hypothetical protein